MKKIIFLALILSYQFLWAQQPATDPSSQEALKQTQDLLKNQQQRENYIKNDKAAQKVNNNVNSLTGGNKAMNDEMYNLAADVMATFAEKAKKPNGEIDVEKMKELMMQYQANPEAFYRQMTPEQQKRVQELGKKIGPAPASQK